LVNTSSGSPIANAQINVVSPTLGGGITYTNAEGEFSCRIPKNQSLTLNLKLICSSNNTWATAYSETIISEEVDISGTYTAELTNFYPITGTLRNCSGQLLAAGYVRMGFQIYTIMNGVFNIQTCATGSYSFRGYNTTNPDNIKVSQIINVTVNISGANAGNIQVCTNMFGTVNDIQGNIYETVLIGDQWWMAENLHTATYANGDPIENVTDNTAWSQLTTGGWCYSDNNLVNDAIYGKLYNFYTTVDPRGLCPSGWHVPSDGEWMVLTDFLGGISVAGGKMKSTTGFIAPNTGATNESNFSCLPGGQRTGNIGSFSATGGFGFWWSSTEFSATNAFRKYLYYDGSNVLEIGEVKKAGNSIRCLKD
jgi:uncharacterized protein (TIGR02145 family)